MSFSNSPTISFNNDQEDAQTGTSSRRSPLGIAKWLTLTKTPEFGSVVPGREVITDTELARHKKVDDMWMALPQHGKMCVFDITEFAKYHPGGVDILLENAGTDASLAYQLAHSYVSVDMIGKSRKGFLVRSRPGQSKSSNSLLPSMITSRPISSPTKKPSWTWTEGENRNVNLTICFPEFPLTVGELHALDGLRVVTTRIRPSVPDKRAVLGIRTLLGNSYHRLILRLLEPFSPILSSVRFTTVTSTSAPDATGFKHTSSKIQLLIGLDRHVPYSSDTKPAQSITAVGSILLDSVTPTFNEPNLDTDNPFYDCIVTESHRLDGTCYRFIRLVWSSDKLWMPVPLGHHVMLRLPSGTGEFVCRPYTPVYLITQQRLEYLSDSSVTKDVMCGTQMELLIKIIPTGQFSPLVDGLCINDSVSISLPMGQIPCNVLCMPQSDPPEPFTDLFLLAAGSGITPMLRILAVLFSSEKFLETCVHLICFDRTQTDQVLVSEFNNLARRYPNRFSILRMLSEPEENEGDFVNGMICDDICRRGLLTLHLKNSSPSDVVDCVRWLICGPPAFNAAANEIAQKWNVQDRYITIFKG